MRTRNAIVLATLGLAAGFGNAAAPRAQSQAQQQQAPVQVEPAERSPFAGVQCLAHAQQTLQLVDQTAYSLCLGAGSDAPMQCFAAARASMNLTDPQIVALCRCANNTAPVQCFLMARRQAFLLDDQLIAMCSAVVTQQLFGGDCSARRY